MEIILTFSNTNHSVKAEQALLSGGVNTKVMPLPSVIRAGCGLCLRVEPGDLEQSLSLLEAAGVPVESRWKRISDGGQTRYEPLEGEE